MEILQLFSKPEEIEKNAKIYDDLIKIFLKKLKNFKKTK
jgi:hypothetical protein